MIPVSGWTTTYKVSSESANVRTGPGTRFRVIERLPQRTKVDSIKEQESWVQIRLKTGRKGWLHRSLLSIPDRSIVFIENEIGKPVSMYRESHALLIGISDYTAGWDDLESIPHEMKVVEKILKIQGFNVIKHLNPTSETLPKLFDDFIKKYGHYENNRLLFFYSGHGHSWVERSDTKNIDRGFLVPADAPVPDKSKKNPGRAFLAKALPMENIMTYARVITAKHALFVFDSCFSGTIFKQRGTEQQPLYITESTSQSVRQFITAGSANQTVPAKSIFVPLFIDAIKNRSADFDKDGYITGTELGYFLKKEVPRHNPYPGYRLTPQDGKIPDYELSRGDFVFALPGALPIKRKRIFPPPIRESVPVIIPEPIPTRPKPEPDKPVKEPDFFVIPPP